MKLNQSEIELLVDGTIEWLQNNSTVLPDNYNIVKPTLKQKAVSIAWVESNFITTAANKHSTAKGLFQILDGTAKDIQDRILKYKIPNYNVFNPEHNALLGVAYLSYQLKRYGTWDKAIIAYNQGSFRENKDSLAYLNKVDTTHTKLYSSKNDYSSDEDDSREVVIEKGVYPPTKKDNTNTNRRNYYVK
jgi:SLT domain-containing protein